MLHKLGRKSPQTTKELLDIATTHASGEDAVGAIVNHRRHNAKHDKEPDIGLGERFDKRKTERRRHDEVLVAATG